MTFPAYLEIDHGKEFAGQTTFECRPGIGDLVTYRDGDQNARAKVIGFEHRQRDGGFFFAVLAEREADQPTDIGALISMTEPEPEYDRTIPIPGTLTP